MDKQDCGWRDDVALVSCYARDLKATLPLDRGADTRTDGMGGFYITLPRDVLDKLKRNGSPVPRGGRWARNRATSADPMGLLS
jgi:hypothetical protein